MKGSGVRNLVRVHRIARSLTARQWVISVRGSGAVFGVGGFFHPMFRYLGIPEMSGFLLD